MENLLVDWVRHDAVRAKQFDHLSHHDYGRMEDETFFQKLQNGQDFGEKHVFDGNERTHWEYNLRARNSPGTVGICIDMSSTTGYPTDMIEVFWGSSQRLDQAPVAFAIDVLTVDSFNFVRVFERKEDTQRLPTRTSSADEKGDSDSSASSDRGDFEPGMEAFEQSQMTSFDFINRSGSSLSTSSESMDPQLAGDRFARDYPGVTATRVSFPHQERLRAICIKVFNFGAMEDFPAIRRVHAWGKVSHDPAKAMGVMVSTAGPSLTQQMDPRLFTVPLQHGILALDTTQRSCFGQSPRAQARLKLGQENFLGVMATMPMHIVQEMLCYLNMKSLFALRSVSKNLGNFGQDLWTSTDVECKKSMFNWARMTCAKVAATSRWNNTEKEDPNNLIDGSNDTWWSSAQGVNHCEIRIDLGYVCPIEKIDVLWGDDNGRIRPCSKRFEIFLSKTDAARPGSVFQNNTDNVGEGWNGNDGPVYLPDRDVLQYTTTSVTLKGESLARFVTLKLYERAPRWANHAISQIQIYGFARPNDVNGMADMALVRQYCARATQTKMPCGCQTS